MSDESAVVAERGLLTASAEVWDLAVHRGDRLHVHAAAVEVGDYARLAGYDQGLYATRSPAWSRK